MDQELSYDGVHCSLIIQRFSDSVLVLRISGQDVGEFGENPMHALSRWLLDLHRVDFFIDARNVRGATIDVSGDWAKWLGRNKSKLRSVTMLTGSRFVQITAEFVRRFAELEGIMSVYDEADRFDQALNRALRGVPVDHPQGFSYLS